MKKRFLALFLVLVLCLAALPGAAFAHETTFLSPLPATFDFNALRLNGSCIAELEAACSDALALAQRDASEEELFSAWNRMIELQNEVELQYVLTMIRYYQHPETYSQAYADIVAGKNAAFSKLLATEQSLLSAIRAGNSLCVKTDCAPEFVFGPYRLTKFARFLLDKFYPVYMRLCHGQGTLMVDYPAEGAPDPQVETLLGGLNERSERFAKEFYGY